MSIDFSGILNAIKNFGLTVLATLGVRGGTIDFGQLFMNMVGLAVGFVILVAVLKRIPSIL